MKTSPTRFLLTNDDGVDAPGLAALQRAAEPLGDCFVVAPNAAYSGCGHRVTTHQPIAIARQSDDRIAIDGTPADCVRLALHHLVPDVDWVLSGINEGGNLGTDIHHSGTVAAVREAVIHGVPGIAVSHYIVRGRPIDWERAAEWTARVLAVLFARDLEREAFWNVNLPHLEPGAPDPEVVFCPADASPLPLRYRLEGDSATYAGDYHLRARRGSSDVDVCFRGQISVSLVHLFGSAPSSDRTDSADR